MERESKYLRQTSDTFTGRMWQRYYYYEGELKIKLKQLRLRLQVGLREQFAFYSKASFAFAMFLALDAYVLGMLSGYLSKETEFFFAFLFIGAAYACLHK